MNNFWIGFITGIFSIIVLSLFIGAYKGMWLMTKSNKFYLSVLDKRQKNRIKKRDKLMKNEKTTK